MAVELASAYVSIVPTTKGIQGALEKELSPLSGAAAKAGTDSGKALGSSFTGASGGLKSGVADAEGAISKFKGSATGALKDMGISAGVLGLAGGAAIAGFGIKAVGAFTETAKAAIDLSTATGLSTEEASRWLGVADDYQVSGEALQTGLGKIAKTMDNVKWAKYGIATRDAGGAARSTNDILLDSFDKLSKITNATEQARVGQELFGKGYQSLTPILGHTRAEYEKMLGSVEKGQVITADEAAKAEKMRLAEDQLGDAVKELTLSFGQQLASLSPLLVGLARLLDLVGKLQTGFGGANHEFQKGTDYLAGHTKEVERSGQSQEYFTKQLAAGKISAAELESELKKYDDIATNAQTSTLGYSYALQDVNQAAIDAEASVRNSTNSTLGYSSAVYDVEQSTKNAQAATDAYKEHTQSMADDAKRNLDTIKVHWDILRGDISNDQSWANLKLGFIDLKDKITAAWDAGAKGAEDATKKTLEAQVAIDGQKTAVLDYNDQVLKLPQERLTKILALVDKGSLDAAQAALDNLTRNYNVNAFIQLHSGAGFSGQKTFATGGYTPGGAVWVGEKGRELVDLPRGSYVHTNVESMNMTSSLENLSPNSTRAGLHVDHVEVHNDTDADGFFRYANFVLAGV